MKKILLLVLLTVFFIDAWESSILYKGNDDKFVYESDGEGNKIPDFSYAGFKNSEEEIPVVETKVVLSSSSGDRTSDIQKAIDSVGNMSLDASGIRGAVLLEAGEYEVHGTIKIPYSGVVLRGISDDYNNGTVIKGIGDTPHQRNIIEAGNYNFDYYFSDKAGSDVNITTDIVYVGDKTFDVTDASTFTVGDNIIIYHSCSNEWLSAIDYGGVPSESSGENWKENQYPIAFNRFITKISGNTITVDAPVYNTLNKSLSQSYIYKLDRSDLETMIGVENLFIDIVTNGDTANEDHPWNALDIRGVEDGWVKNVTAQHFGLSGIRISASNRITVDSCKAIYPHGIITGSRRYNFNCYAGAQQILFKDCYANHGRHMFVSNGTSFTSGVVVLRGTTDTAFTSSEGHRHWTTGMLFDNYVHNDGYTPSGGSGRILGLYNRGDWGTGHGWSNAHSVVWNSKVPEASATNERGRIVVQKPPTAQNYAIGCFGYSVGNESAPFAGSEGFVEGTGVSGLEPVSLFEAQLAERLSDTPVGTIETTSQNRNIAIYNILRSGSKLVIRFTQQFQNNGSIKLFTGNGKLILKQNVLKGEDSININYKSISKGIVFLKLENNSHIIRDKITIFN